MAHRLVVWPSGIGMVAPIGAFRSGARVRSLATGQLGVVTGVQGLDRVVTVWREGERCRRVVLEPSAVVLVLRDRGHDYAASFSALCAWVAVQVGVSPAGGVTFGRHMEGMYRLQGHATLHYGDAETTRAAVTFSRHIEHPQHTHVPTLAIAEDDSHALVILALHLLGPEAASAARRAS